MGLVVAHAVRGSDDPRIVGCIAEAQARNTRRTKHGTRRVCGGVAQRREYAKEMVEIKPKSRALEVIQDHQRHLGPTGVPAVVVMDVPVRLEVPN